MSLEARSATPTARRAGGAGALATVIPALLFGAWMVLAAVAGVGGAALEAGAGATAGVSAGSPSALAHREIPSPYLRLYGEAARRYGLDWAVLAAIGKVECDHGRDPDPSCGHEAEVNSAGAGGPMQFIASTWARYGVDGDGDGRKDRWDPSDAIFAAANYLAGTGAPQDYRRAIFAYNHAGWYVAEVETWAARYRGSGSSQSPGADPLDTEVTESAGGDVRLQNETDTPVRFVPGPRAMLSPGDGHVALIPTGVPGVVAAMLVAGDELQGLPYGPGGHPDPRGAAEQDCSSTVSYVLYRSGVRSIGEILRDNPLAQDYVRWGQPGPGRWVSIYSTTTPSAHTFMVIAGIRLDTSHNGTDVGPNRDEDGPRWRILEHIPTWAHWSVRHPPGL